MSLPEFKIPTPNITDTFQEYAVGDYVGGTVGTDKWEIKTGDTGMYIGQTPNMYNGLSTRCVYGGFRFAAYKATLSANQYVVAQCIIPLDNLYGAFPGVRVDPQTGDGYYAVNMGSVEGDTFDVFVICRKNGAEVAGFTLSVPFAVSGGGNMAMIDGIWQSDGIVVMLEAAGINPTRLRVSAMLGKNPTGYPQPTAGSQITTDVIINWPDDVCAGVTMPHAYVCSAEYQHYGSNQILSGRAGIWNIGANAAGALLNFNAGEITLPPVFKATPSTGTYPSVQSVTLVAYVDDGTFTTPYPDPMTFLYSFDEDPKEALTIDEVTNTVVMDNGIPITDGVTE